MKRIPIIIALLFAGNYFQAQIQQICIQEAAQAGVEANGADLGEMNRLLMQKVEELTLYVIDLQKQIEELRDNNK